MINIGERINTKNLLTFVFDLFQREQRPRTSILDELLDSEGQNSQIIMIEIAYEPDHGQHSVITLNDELPVRGSKSIGLLRIPAPNEPDPVRTVQIDVVGP